MPVYEVEDDQGNLLELEGDSPPTEQELEEIFAQFRTPDPVGQPLPSEELTVADRARDFATTLGNEFGDVRDFILQGISMAAQAEQGGNPLATPEQRQNIARGFQQNIDEIQARSLERQAETEQAKAQSPIAGTMGQIVGEIASLPIGGPTRTVAQRLGTSAAQGALSGAIEPGTAEQRLQNVAQGAALGAVGGGVLEGVGAGVRRARSTPDNEVIDAGEREGVSVFFDDVTQSGAARRIGSLNENVPVVGAERGRIRQNREARLAGERRVDELQSQVRNLGGDPDELYETIQGSLRERLDEVRGQARVKFQQVDALLDQTGEFTPNRLNNFLDDAIAEEQARGSRASNQLIEVLQSFRNAPESQGGTFSSMRRLRSELGDEISAYYTGENVNIGKKGVDRLQQAKQAIDRDMEEHAFNADRVAWRQFREANQFYAENVVPFKQRGLRELVKTEEPEKAWRFLVANGGADSRSVRLYRSLTPKGRAAVRLGYVLDAFEAADGDKAFSTARMATLLENRESVAKQFFQGNELREITGFTKLMRAIERSGQVAENPPTGNRLASMLFTAGAVIEPVSAGSMAAGGLGLNTMFQTKAGRNFLMGAAASTPGTVKFDQLLGRLETYLARTLARDDEGSSPSANAIVER